MAGQIIENWDRSTVDRPTAGPAYTAIALDPIIQICRP